MEVPEVRYAKSGDVHIAYQRFGTGPDVVAIPPLVSNVELMWEHEVYRRFLELRAQRTCTLQFDKRGVGMSDRIAHAPTLEQRIGDIVAVMDAEGLARAHLIGVSEGGLMAQHFAATHPERVDRMVLINSSPGLAALPELPAHAIGPLPSFEETLARFARLIETWGRQPEFMAAWFVPSQCESTSFLRWFGRFQRHSASPADLQRQIENVASLSVSKERLAAITAPTLVVQVVGDRVIPSAAGRYLATHVPGAELFEVEGEDHFCITMSNWHEVTTRFIDFLVGETATRPPAPMRPAAAVQLVVDRRATLRREGAVWALTYQGRTFGLPHGRGLRDLQHLLLHPGTDVHVRDLDALHAAMDSSLLRPPPAREGDAGPVLDDAARRSYRSRLGELRGELNDAERCNDLGRAETVRAEIDALEAELRAAVGLGGRPRHAGSQHERQRVAVSKRIRGAMARISTVCPELGEHLRRSVRTGTHCRYAPAAGDRLDWTA